MNDLIQKLAEYYVLASNLNKTNDSWDYEHANRLSLELFMRLPANNYRALRRGLHGQSKDLFALLNLMRENYGASGVLFEDDLIIHRKNLNVRR